jgi:hypothetical protein
MSVTSWELIKVTFCHHVDKEVALEAEMAYPADLLPDTTPRILAHRCSEALLCNLDGRPSCIWAGTNPTYDPFSD